MSSTTEPPKKQLKMDNDIGNVGNDGDLDYDEKTQTALEEIDACQNDIDALNEKASEEILHVEQKYNKLRKPHYDARNDVISKIPKFWLICVSFFSRISILYYYLYRHNIVIILKLDLLVPQGVMLPARPRRVKAICDFTISNTRATFAYHSFCDNLRLQCTSQTRRTSMSQYFDNLTWDTFL